jgi:hypothetical protein
MPATSPPALSRLRHMHTHTQQQQQQQQQQQNAPGPLRGAEGLRPGTRSTKPPKPSSASSHCCRSAGRRSSVRLCSSATKMRCVATSHTVMAASAARSSAAASVPVRAHTHTHTHTARRVRRQHRSSSGAACYCLQGAVPRTINIPQTHTHTHTHTHTQTHTHTHDALTRHARPPLAGCAHIPRLAAVHGSVQGHVLPPPR